MGGELEKMPGLTFEEATENVKKNLEALSGPSQEEQAKRDFLQVYNTIDRPGMGAMFEWMEKNGFFEAPASSKYHLAHPGGLVIHSLNVWRRLREITHTDFVKSGKSPFLPELEETMAILGLLHDVCKVGVYHQETKRRKNQDTGEWADYQGYTFRDPFPLGHGEKSLFLITRHMALTEEEALAIRWHMGAYDDAVKGGSRSMNEAMNLTPWVWRLQEADMCAAWIDERSAAERGRVLASAKEREREYRWNAPGRSRVVHPAHGAIVVPHSSNLGAVMNAAEVWRCGWAEIMDAKVWAAEPGDIPAKMPYII